MAATLVDVAVIDGRYLRAQSSLSASCSSPEKADARPLGIKKITPVTPALVHFLNSPSASRVDAVKRIWSYSKLHNLPESRNKREIYSCGRLKSIFDGKEKIGFLEIGKESCWLATSRLNNPM